MPDQGRATTMTFSEANSASGSAAGEAEALLDFYNRWFEVVPANSPSLLREVLRLRYKVYCVENQFEDATAHPDGLENDPYDDRSVHSLLRYRATGETVGTVRLVLPSREREALALPIGQVCDERHLVQALQLPVTTTAEISRFAVSKDFRRRASDANVIDGGFSAMPPVARLQSRRALPHITLGLMKAVARMSVENGITHLVAVMEPALLRLISRLGVAFTPIGSLVDYHGLRQPCYATCHDLGKGILFRRPEAMELITDKGEYWKPYAASSCGDPPKK
jgi:N-acyl amino acid synthase of PEP-CTERM/exosortase system